MGEKKASVRLEAKDSGFRRTLLGAEGAVKQSAQRMGSAYSSSLSAGAKGGFDALKSMFSTLKSGMMGLTGIAGGIGMAALVKGAIDAETKYRNLSFAIEAGTGRLIEWNELQRQGQEIAQRWGKDSDQLADALGNMIAGADDLEHASDFLDVIATASRATGDELEDLSKIVAILKGKFAITAEEMPEAMAAIIAGANAGGISMQNLAVDFGEVGGKAKTFGLTGVDGMKKMLGILNLAKQETGRFEQAMTALPQIFDQLIERGGKGGELETKLKIKTVGPDGRPKDPFEILTDVIRATKGKEEELGKIGLGGEGLQTILALARPFQTELERTGGDIDAATRVLEKRLQDAAGGALEWSRVLEKAAENMESPAANIDTALETLKQAFTKPEMQEAITSLADNLPELAEGVAKAVDWILKNPVLAGGIVATGTFGKGALGAALQAAFTSTATATSGLGTAATGATTKLGALGAGLGGAVVATAAFAAALAAVSLAVDQASKLGKELEEHDKDLADERENLMHAAELRGETVATRERSSWEKFTSFSRAPTELIRRTPEGKIETTTSRFGFRPDIRGRLTPQIMSPGDVDEAVDALLGGRTAPPNILEEGLRLGGQGRFAQPAQQRPPDHAAAARAMAEAVGNRTLNVKVTNVNELRSPAGGSGAPRPGYEPRP